jgi:hypothetical protein
MVYSLKESDMSGDKFYGIAGAASLTRARKGESRAEVYRRAGLFHLMAKSGFEKKPTGTGESRKEVLRRVGL